MNSSLGRDEDHLCPPEHYFYLEESMDKASGTRKLITFQATNDE
jgi:hypothetical protein